jgi:uncharacterized LabA/DUF88 family protein
MTNNHTSQQAGIALFIDIENFIGDCASLGLEVKIKPINQKLQEIAPVRIRRAYGDIIKAVSATTSGQENVMSNIIKLRTELSGNMVNIEDIPYLHQHKNSADMILSSSALTLAFEKPYLTHFAFVSNDKDYIPIYQKLREMGKSIIAICVDSNNPSSRIIDAVDTLLYYENIASLPPVRPRDPDQHADAGAKNDIALQDSFDLLVRAYRSLEAGGRGSVLIAQLVPRMQQMRADFDFTRYGFLKFLDFLRAARDAGYIDLIKLENRGPTDCWQIELPTEVKSAPSRLTKVEQKIINLEKKNDPQEIVQLYTQILDERLKIKFPDQDRRRLILNACLAFQSALPLPLEDFSNIVADNVEEGRFKATDDIRRATFKMLLSLFYARSFSIDATRGYEHNPYLVSLIYQREQELETRLEAHFAKTLRNNCLHLPRPEDLAHLYYGETPTAKQIQHCEEIISEIRYW